MKAIFASFLLLFSFSVYSNAQTSSQKDTSTKQDNISDTICINPEITAMYPGGEWAFKMYLKKHFIYSDDDVRGVVVVKFIVSKDDKVSNIEAIDGPKELRNDAIKMIQKSGIWIPGINNGKKVTSYRTVSIKFPNDDF